jgi:hypothetical protein
MFIHEILVEAIQNRPRNMPVYLASRIKELDQMLVDLAQAKQLIEANVSEGESTIRYAARSGAQDTPDHEHSYDIHTLEYLDLDNEFQIKRLKENLESYLRFLADRAHDFLKYVMNSLEDVKKYERQDYLDQARRGFNLLQYVEAGLEMEGYTGDALNDPEYIAATKLLMAYRLKAKVFQRIIPLEADLTTKLSVVVRMHNHAQTLWSPDKYRPEHEAVETLYHATAFVTEILRDGFSAEKPMERVGVGNFGTQQEISFTHDLEIARTIMRSFKELWMIAHGQLTAHQILSWAKVEGILDQVQRGWGGYTHRPMPTGRHDDPAEVANLYRYWLTFTKTRSNPMLVAPWEIVEVMKTRAIKDIGVLACKVNLEGETDYKFGEAEFRVMPDKVLSIKQVL